LRESGIPDAKGRAGRHPGRFEAENMQLQGYTPVDVTPWEGASGGKAVSCPAKTCSATLRYTGESGTRTLTIQYFDQNNGVARMPVSVQGKLVDEWQLSDHVPTQKIDSSSSTRRTIPGIALRPGDEIRIEGFPDGAEAAALDYVEIM